MRGFALLIVLLLPIPALAQQLPGATLTGTILCSDTNAPARFARISLKPTSIEPLAIQEMQDRINANVRTPIKLSDEQMQERRTSYAINISNGQQRNSSTAADINGHYLINGIAPGVYFVEVDMPGYVDAASQFSFKDVTNPDSAVRARIAKSLTMVTIVGEEEQRLNLNLERGASVSGRVLFEDGAPAVGWNISVLPVSSLGKKDTPLANASTSTVPQVIGTNGLPYTPGVSSIMQSRTDDLGNFRVPGLTPGDYVVQAQFTTTEAGRKGMVMDALYRLTIYSGDTLHAADAKSFTLIAGQTRSGENLTVVLHSLHSIRGQVSAQSDGHPVNSGHINVVGTDDPSITGAATINADGTFLITSLPPGKYSIAVTGAGDVRITDTETTMGLSHNITQTSRRYAPTDTAVVLGDVDAIGITIAVADSKLVASSN